MEDKFDPVQIVMVLTMTFMMSFISINIGSPTIKDMEVNALDSVNPLSFSSNSDMASHPELDSGSGTHGDPYIFADMDIDCTSSGSSGLYISETTKYAIFRNITIHASSSSPAIYMKTLTSGGYRAMQITLDNITVIGGGTQLYMNRPYYITVKNCNFSNPSGSGKLIHAYSYGYYTYLKNNTFDAPSMDVDLDYLQYSYIRENSGDFRYLLMDRYRRSDIANNTFTVRTIRLYSGYQSTFQGNNLTGRSDSYDICWIIDCSRLWIDNNSFYGGKDAIFVQHPNTYSPVHTAYYSTTPLIFADNLFNDTSNRGIYFYYASGHARISYVQIHHNIFRGCEGYAIELNSGGLITSKVFRNVFEYNHGSGTTFTIIHTQARDPWSQFSWSDNDVGNFWLDWDNEDDDSNGFTDTKDYTLSSNNGQTDPHPVSNPYFDFNKPEIELLTPEGTLLQNRYVNFSWDADDNETGIEMIQIRKDLSRWINVTGRDHHGLYLPKGQSLIDIRAVDRAGLKKEINLNIQIQGNGEPFTIISPKQDTYYGDQEIMVLWNFIDTVVPKSLTFSEDGIRWIKKDPIKAFNLIQSDGEHTIHLNFTDHYGNMMRYSIGYAIDTVDPNLEILCPKAGSVISNGLVNIKWKVEDDSPIKRTSISIDGGISSDVTGTEHSTLLDRGSHSFKVEVEDQAGNIRSDSIFFTISMNTSLHIKSPRLTSPTRYTDHTIEWEYLTELDIERLQLLLDDNAPLDIPLDTTSWDIALGQEGEHKITIRAQDPAGNIFSDTIMIQVDQTIPDVGFTSPEDSDILNNSDILISWSALEEGGMAGYQLLVDNVTVMEGILDKQSGLTLTAGPHTLKIIATDLAGNQGEETINIIIDTELPSLEILTPGSDIVKEPYFIISWAGYDNIGIAEYNYSIDGKPPQDVGLSTSREVQISEGWHTLTVIAMDVAGNIRKETVDFLSDLHPPEVELDRFDGYFIREWNGLISWNISEVIGISEIIIMIDGAPLSLATDAGYHLTDLEEGEHEISIMVVDIGGWNATDSMSFILDSTPPEISTPEKPVSVRGDGVMLFWELSEDPSGIVMEVIFDGTAINRLVNPEEEEIQFRELDPGPHEVIMMFEDPAGNQRTLNYEFDIEESGGSSGPDNEGSGLIFFIIILIVLIIIALIVFFILRSKRSKGEQDVKEKEELIGPAKKPDRISIGHVPTRPHTRSQPEHNKPAPVPAPITGSKPSGEEGYIRPEKKKGREIQKKVIRDVKDVEKTERSSKVEEDIEELDTWDDVEDWSEIDEFEDYEEMEDV